MYRYELHLHTMETSRSPVRIPDSFALKDVITSGNYELWSPEYDNILKECEAIPHV